MHVAIWRVLKKKYWPVVCGFIEMYRFFLGLVKMTALLLKYLGDMITSHRCIKPPEMSCLLSVLVSAPLLPDRGATQETSQPQEVVQRTQAQASCQSHARHRSNHPVWEA